LKYFDPTQLMMPVWVHMKIMKYNYS
jgi:hypothetical protein